jgi:RND family efflux transporter MFP subunit
MSPTMLLGRVVIPAIGLILAVALTYRAVSDVAPRAVPSVGRPEGGPIAQPRQSDRGRVIAEGRVVAYPGGEVTVGTEVLGTIAAMSVREKAKVRKGDLLAELRSDEVHASLREAHSRLIEAQADLRYEQERLRLDSLLPVFTGRDLRPAGPRYDTAAALARRDSAKAAVERLEAESAKYRIRAPIDGVVVARHADPGETVAAAAPLVTIVDLGRLRVEAEVDEFDTARVSPGARATITAEGYGARPWRGEVEEVADVVVARQARPEDPGRPADTRVLPVRVKFLEATPLRLGQRVEVEIAGRAH